MSRAELTVRNETVTLMDILAMNRSGDGQDDLALQLADVYGFEVYDWGLMRKGSNEIGFVAHLDTVSRADDVITPVRMGSGIIVNSNGGILGADDGAGVWSCLQFLKKTDATIILTRDEEVGGIGADELLESSIKLPKRLIELDRKGEMDVVWKHGSNECGSLEFASEVAQALGMWTSDGGVYTDVATLCQRVPECVNLSVGYHNAHTRDEYLNGEFLKYLVKRILEHYEQLKSIPVFRKAERKKRYSNPRDDYMFDYDWRHGIGDSNKVVVHTNSTTPPIREEWKTNHPGHIEGFDPCDRCFKSDCGTCEYFEQSRLYSKW